MDGVIRIEKVVAEMDVWLDPAIFPFAKIRLKVLERSHRDYAAFANACLRNRVTREPDGIAGLGASIEEAVHDLLTRFVAKARVAMPNTGFANEDFVWSASEDF